MYKPTNDDLATRLVTLIAACEKLEDTLMSEDLSPALEAAMWDLKSAIVQAQDPSGGGNLAAALVEMLRREVLVSIHDQLDPAQIDKLHPETIAVLGSAKVGV